MKTVPSILEDELHVLTECSLYDNIKSKLKQTTKSVIEDGTDLRSLYEDPTHVRDLARFLILRRCHDRRFPKYTEEVIKTKSNTTWYWQRSDAPENRNWAKKSIAHLPWTRCGRPQHEQLCSYVVIICCLTKDDVNVITLPWKFWTLILAMKSKLSFPFFERTWNFFVCLQRVYYFPVCFPSGGLSLLCLCVSG